MEPYTVSLDPRNKMNWAMTLPEKNMQVPGQMLKDIKTPENGKRS